MFLNKNRILAREKKIVYLQNLTDYIVIKKLLS